MHNKTSKNKRAWYNHKKTCICGRKTSELVQNVAMRHTNLHKLGNDELYSKYDHLCTVIQRKQIMHTLHLTLK